ncbi:unnamed protein product, partial [Ectocarpus sp. 12 AP-2014]
RTLEKKGATAVAFFAATAAGQGRGEMSQAGSGFRRQTQRQLSTMTQSAVIGVSADRSADTEDWSQEFDRPAPTAAAVGAGEPTSPASRRLAALRRIAGEDPPHPRRPEPPPTMVTTSTRAVEPSPAGRRSSAASRPTAVAPASRSGGGGGGSSGGPGTEAAAAR